MKAIRQTRPILVYEDPANHWVRVYFDEVVFPDGRRGRYNRIIVGEGGQAQGAVIIPFVSASRVLLVKQHRYPIDKFMLEFPRGFGRVGVSALEVARAELEEETSYRAREVTQIGTLYPDSGLLANEVGVFVARGLEPLQNNRTTEQSEFIDRAELSVSELESQISSGTITDSFTLAAFALLRAKQADGYPPV